MPPYLFLLPMIILQGGAIVGTVNVKGSRVGGMFRGQHVSSPWSHLIMKKTIPNKEIENDVGMVM